MKIPKTFSRLARAMATASALLACGLVAAQDYPARPVRIIVPQTPGSGTDITTRFIAERLSQE
ncbi:MAG: hypothetical protein EOO54_29230, partial [Haliea sp.]